MTSGDPKTLLAIKADRVFLPILWLLLLLSFFLSKRYGTTNLTFMISLPLAVIPSLFIFLKPGAFITRVTVAVALMLFTALHIHQAMGMTELHFGIFVLLAFLLCYQDWRVIVIAAAVAAAHHLSFNYLQQMGINAICFTEPSIELVVIHAAYVVAEAGVLSYLAIVLNGETTKAANSNTNLKAMLASVRQTSDQVEIDVDALTETSRDIAQSTADLSMQITAQAQALRTASTSMESVAATAHSTAEALQRADHLIGSASTLAARGGSSAKDVLASMAKIDACSNQIADIVSLVDGFAFQLNILSLNASVEAANAGAHGKGFAVVASEVRALARHSATAAQEIRQLIEAAVKEVKSGGQLAEKAGSDMESISGAIRQVISLTADISRAGQQQSEEIDSTTKQISRLDEVTQTNTALIQRVAQATSALYNHASDVSLTVAKLNRNGERDSVPAVSRPKREANQMPLVGAVGTPVQ